MKFSEGVFDDSLLIEEMLMKKGRNETGKMGQEKLSKRAKDRARGDAARQRSVGVWRATSSEMLFLSDVFGGNQFSHALGDANLQLFPD